mmetsp:Transcript_11679/g.28710  ORF Transcript_11679/g.28710 Transcript_11679/m.28710 type:complete len:158 (+) Transcript_11679:124-597(+)
MSLCCARIGIHCSLCHSSWQAVSLELLTPTDDHDIVGLRQIMHISGQRTLRREDTTHLIMCCNHLLWRSECLKGVYTCSDKGGRVFRDVIDNVVLTSSIATERSRPPVEKVENLLSLHDWESSTSFVPLNMFFRKYEGILGGMARKASHFLSLQTDY